MTIDGTNWTACMRFVSDLATPATIYPSANMPVSKDLVPDTIRAERSTLGLPTVVLVRIAAAPPGKSAAPNCSEK
jgi:succinate dehydrogenase/fumarate reductase-like Fe-S protein